ncbi:MAG: WYL domain-containing protein [Spirochaetaceae bacterium]|nr:WYL domain-containing protein [Spirochaetaceae bacterium]
MSNLERLAYIDRRVRESGRVRVAEVAGRFEVSERQVKRDIEYLRYRLGAPIEWVRAERAYRYVEAWSGLDFLGERSLFAYVVASSAAASLATNPIAESRALGRLLDLVPEDLRPLIGAVRFETPHFEPGDVERLVLLLGAMRDGVLAEGSYRDAGGQVKERRFAPRRLINYGGVWYCAAWDEPSAELRMFRVSRFESLAGTRGPDPRADGPAELDAFLSGSYGIFKGAARGLATARFYGWARETVAREVWHDAEARRPGVDPRRGPYLELDLPVSHYEELVGRILRFGSQAEAVAPPDFRARWAAEIRAMAAVAGAGTAGGETT